ASCAAVVGAITLLAPSSEAAVGTGVEPPIFDPAVDVPLPAPEPVEDPADPAPDPDGDGSAASQERTRRRPRLPKALNSKQVVEGVHGNAPSLGGCVRRSRLAGELVAGTYTLALTFEV